VTPSTQCPDRPRAPSRLRASPDFADHLHAPASPISSETDFAHQLHPRLRASAASPDLRLGAEPDFEHQLHALASRIISQPQLRAASSAISIRRLENVGLRRPPSSECHRTRRIQLAM